MLLICKNKLCYDVHAGIMFTLLTYYCSKRAHFEASSHYTSLMCGWWRCDEDVILYITQCCWIVSVSLSFSLFECVSFSVLWKVLLSVGPRLTPTETVNYQRWQRSFHLATITHIPQPPSKDLQSPTQVQGRCSVGTSWGGGEQVGVGMDRWVCLTGTLHWHKAVRTYCMYCTGCGLHGKLFSLSINLFSYSINFVRSVKCQTSHVQESKSQSIYSLLFKPRLS